MARARLDEVHSLEVMSVVVEGKAIPWEASQRSEHCGVSRAYV
jgi:hypothetical protein